MATKPSFRAAFRSGRVLVPADGFYEWRRDAGGKQPFYIRPADGLPVVFAGILDTWTGDAGPVDGCAIITTGANELMAPIHDRMPVILAPEAWDEWLAGEDSLALADLLKPCPAAMLQAYPVSKRVNSPANDDPALLECNA